MILPRCCHAPPTRLPSPRLHVDYCYSRYCPSALPLASVLHVLTSHPPTTPNLISHWRILPLYSSIQALSEEGAKILTLLRKKGFEMFSYVGFDNTYFVFLLRLPLRVLR